MYETPAEIAELQGLLEASFAAASQHLLSIMTPDRRVGAERLVAELPSPAVLSIATVTKRGEPRISAVDGHFLHGHWYFTTLASSLKARQLAGRGSISASFLPKPTFGVFCHGRAERLTDGPDRAMLIEHCLATYHQSPDEWGSEIGYYRIDAHWLVAFDGSKAAAARA